MIKLLEVPIHFNSEVVKTDNTGQSIVGLILIKEFVQLVNFQ